MVKQFNKILNALEVNPERALEELNLDWTCSQEIADELMRKYEVPFRTGHHFASEIVTYARAHNIPPSEFAYADACIIYQRLAQEDAALPQKLPLTEAEFRACLDPVAIVNNRAVKGGPQPSELKIMFAQADKDLAQNINWQKQAAAKVANAEMKLNGEFASLLK